MWRPHYRNLRFIEFVGERDAIVDTRHLEGNGYLWQCRKKYGYAETIELAKEWVEALCEHYSIPASKRWLKL